MAGLVECTLALFFLPSLSLPPASHSHAPPRPARVASLVMVVARKPAGKGKAPAARKGGANRKSIRTRAAADGTAAAPPAPAAPAPSVGQLTSHIANKQARGAMYAKLKHKAAVSGMEWGEREEKKGERQSPSQRSPRPQIGRAHV